MHSVLPTVCRRVLQDMSYSKPFLLLLLPSPTPSSEFFKNPFVCIGSLGVSAQGYAPMVNTVGAGMPATRAVVDCWHGHFHTTPAANIPQCTVRWPYRWKRSRWPRKVWICTIERGHNWPLTPATSIIYLFLQPLFRHSIWHNIERLKIVFCRETRMLHLSKERCPKKLTRKRQDSADTTGIWTRPESGSAPSVLAVDVCVTRPESVGAHVELTAAGNSHTNG